jgi:hypothetical protein
MIAYAKRDGMLGIQGEGVRYLQVGLRPAASMRTGKEAA